MLVLSYYSLGFSLNVAPNLWTQRCRKRCDCVTIHLNTCVSMRVTVSCGPENKLDACCGVFPGSLCCAIRLRESLCHQQGKSSTSRCPCSPTLSLGMRRSSEPCFRNTFPAKHSTEQRVKRTVTVTNASKNTFLMKTLYIHSFVQSVTSKSKTRAYTFKPKP